MIKLESVHIEEIRGIRKLDLNFGKEKFAISGPNGTGKSGVIDGIEFALTGKSGDLQEGARRGFLWPSMARMWTRQNSQMRRHAAGFSNETWKVGDDHTDGIVPEKTKDRTRRS